MGDTPIRRAQIALSGVGLRSRVNKAEQRAVNPKPKPKPKAKRKKPPVLKPQQSHVDARQAKIAAATAADEAAIKARGLRRR